MKSNKAFLIGMLISLVGVSSYFVKKEVQGYSVETGVNAVYSSNIFDIVQEKKAIQYLSENGFNQISFNIRYFQKTDTSSRIDTMQIPSFENLSPLIREAQKRNLQVILRPLIDSKGGSPRHLFNPANPQKWFSEYSSILEKLAKFSEKEKIYRLDVGVELDDLLMKYPKKFNTLVQKTRKNYGGKISYSINFFQEDSLLVKTASSLEVDFLGIDYYVPIKNKQEKLMGFENKYYLDNLLSYSKKPIILSEFGYRSIGGSGKTPWNHIKKDKKDFFGQKSLYNSIFFTLSHLKNKDKSKIVSISFWIKDKRDFSQDIFEADTLGYSPFGKPAEEAIFEYNQKRKFFKKLGLIKD